MTQIADISGVIRYPRFFGCNSVLQKVQEVEFDPYNPEHMECARSLLYRDNMDNRAVSPEVTRVKLSRKDPGLKFKLKAGFSTVPDMMAALILQKVFRELETQQ